jgi:hypothetical protein
MRLVNGFWYSLALVAAVLLAYAAVTLPEGMLASPALWFLLAVMIVAGWLALRPPGWLMVDGDQGREPSPWMYFLIFAIVGTAGSLVVHYKYHERETRRLRMRETQEVVAARQGNDPSNAPVALPREAADEADSAFSSLLLLFGMISVLLTVAVVRSVRRSSPPPGAHHSDHPNHRTRS